MDAQGITALIGSVGFPIVMCLIMWKYMEQIQADNKDTIAKLTEAHKQETDSLKESLNNNTTVLAELKTMLQMLVQNMKGDSNEKN